MLDFFYGQTNYRQYIQFNHLVSSSARQIASGIKEQEYLVYDEDGGSITINLSDTELTDTFKVLWYDPKDGSTQHGESIPGGSVRTVQSPFQSDTVLLLTLGPKDNDAPTAPTGVTIN